MADQPVQKEESKIIKFLRELFSTPKGKLYSGAAEKAGLIRELDDGPKAPIDTTSKIPEKLLRKQAGTRIGGLEKYAALKRSPPLTKAAKVALYLKQYDLP